MKKQAEPLAATLLQARAISSNTKINNPHWISPVYTSGIATESKKNSFNARGTMSIQDDIEQSIAKNELYAIGETAPMDWQKSCPTKYTPV